ncbi:Proteasomal ATPase-associated factor 1, partial [Homalodisca vitripennis]
KLEGEAWISYKVKDEKSIHGKLRCTQIATNGLPKITASNGFSVEKISKDSLQVKFKDAPFATTFIAASKVYSGIHKKGIISLGISHKGYSVSACKDNQLVVWDFNQGELKCTLTGHVGDVYKCKFFPSGVVVLSGGADMQLKIWCALTGTCPVTLVGHTMAVTDFDFIGRGKNVLSVSKDGLAKLWCCASSSCIADLVKLGSTINCCQVFTAPASLPLGQPESEPRNLTCRRRGLNSTHKLDQMKWFLKSCSQYNIDYSPPQHTINRATHEEGHIFLAKYPRRKGKLKQKYNTRIFLNSVHPANKQVEEGKCMRTAQPHIKVTNI